MGSFNVADIIVILILVVCTYFYYHKGLVHTLLGFCSTLFSVVLSRLLSPFVADFFRKTAIFDSIRDYVKTSIISNNSATGSDFINSLTIPDFLKNSIMQNNNSSGFGKFNVTNIQDYVSSYIASFIISIISMIVVFIILFILFKFLSKTLNIIARIPVIKTANKLGGGILGFAQGVLIIWIGLAVLTMLYGKPMFNGAVESVSNSLIACKFYDSNILINGLSAINYLF